MTGTDSVLEIKGVGEALAKKLAQVGIVNVEDLLLYYPYRYEDYSNLLKIDQIQPGPVSIKAVIRQVKGRWVRAGMHVTEAVASDDTSSVKIVWFNQPYREASIKKGEQYFISGQYEFGKMQMSLNSPSIELASDFPVNTARIIPVYKQTKNLKSDQIRKLLKEVFASMIDVPTILPSDIQDQNDLVDKHTALKSIHFPNNSQDLEAAKLRLGFEEVFELILSNLLLKNENMRAKAIKVDFDEELARKFVSKLGFKLTDSQRAAIWQLYQDIQKPHPANRLLQGDVGSGKTVVAAMAALMCTSQGLQAALMAPTEILAKQHAKSIFDLLEPVGLNDSVCLLVGSMSAKQKALARKNIESGKAKFLIGTHALIQEKIKMANLALVIVDEQHRFGVEERKKLLKKTGHQPHMLSMTATPIPRSLALTVYGELDVSVLREKPKNRKPINTKLVTLNQRTKTYESLKPYLEKSGQVFVVCPLIDESSMVQARSVGEIYKELTRIFKGFKVRQLHGKMKAEDKESTMQEFSEGKIDVLVATTVIEVGVDVPNANVMVIESPERFGLAQIHQLRGRVGRGDKASYCYLMLSDAKAPSKRLRAVENSTDGFRLADLDLEIRGPGAIYGARQHGELDLRLVKFTDTKLIRMARKSAEEYANNPDKLLQYPLLVERIKKLQKINHLN